MFQNYLKIALRNLVQHKAFSFINVFGLALSMAVCLPIIAIIRDAYSYDKFHPNGGRIYRILTEAQRKDGGSEPYATSPYLVAKTLTEDYDQVELWTPLLQSLNGVARSEGKELPDIQGLYTDGSFFKMFGFELAAGDPATALDEPWSIVLTQELAEKFFKDENPIGKEIEMPGYNGRFKVTGVLKKQPGKSHIKFEALGSIATHIYLEKQPNGWNITGDWLNYYGSNNYIRLKEGADPKNAALALAAIAKANYANLDLESRDAGYHFELQALSDITPGRLLSNSSSGAPPSIFLWFLTALGLIIILSASFNYTNLTIARSLLRTKEVGVRKVLGASRGQVFAQLTGEAVVTSLLALVVAFGLFKVGKLYFNWGIFADIQQHIGKEEVALYGWFLLFALGVGVFAGALPAATLSKTTASQIFQKLQNLRLIQKFGLRKTLLGFQFTITLLFFFMMTIVGKQMDHAITNTYGFDRPQTLLVQMPQQDYGKLAAAFSQEKSVESISAISFPMGTYTDRSDDVRSDSITEKTGVRNYFIDHNYCKQFDLSLLAGEDFPENPTQQRELFVLVNELFCKAFKLGSPAEAIGKSLTLGDTALVTVRGVLKDFRFKPANYAIEPLMLRYDPSQLAVMNLQIAGNDLPAAMLGLERVWKQVEPKRPFTAEFYDETVRQVYAEVVTLSWGAGFLGFLGMVIACMGLLGMAMYTVETKAKEISIRKVMGAGARDVAMMLSKGYLLVLAIAVAIATPIAFFLGNQLLQHFDQRISWSVLLFLPGVLLLVVVAGTAIGSQTVRAALANPVKSLRME
ncbi:MAG: ABC transporter permease [Saprospiraceae bacterium]|nr:ABC transporter permease [Saprospiraceae bacterium]